MKLKNIIVHQLDKKQGENAMVNKRESVIPIDSQLEEFTMSFRDAYYKRSNPIYGVFDPNENSFPFQTLLTKYLSDDLSFVDFSKKAIDHFLNTINDVYQATGGYVIFAHFIDSQEFVTTLMLNNKKQYNIDDDNLIIKQIKSLDIEKLDVANFVNIEKWEANSDTYLSFAKGRKNVSNYFLRFIGCTDESSAKQQSSRLKKAVLDYLDKLDINQNEKEDKRNKVFDYCLDKINKKQDVSLNGISDILSEEGIESFSEFAGSEAYEVNSIIKGHKKTLRNLKFYVYRSKELIIEFDSSLITEKRIKFNQSKNQLVINKVPESLKQQILNISNSSD